MLSFLRFLQQHWKRILFRAHKDKRALAASLALLGMGLYFSYSGFLFFKNPLSFVMLGLGAVLAWRMRKSHEKEDESLIRLSQYSPAAVEPRESAIGSLRSEMLRLWLLLWRASSEQFLNEKSLPEGARVLTRRAVLDKLDGLGLRGELTKEELSLHLSPDGEWSRESIAKNILRAAELEALQYCCGVIDALSPIEDFCRLPKLNLENLAVATKDIRSQPRETFDIRRERDIAAAYYLRCYGEQTRRGIVEKSLDPDVQNVLLVSNADAGNQNSDLLLGTQIVSEVAADRLNAATGQAHLRFAALQHALGVLDPQSS
jgi:hypothetical protein